MKKEDQKKVIEDIKGFREKMSEDLTYKALGKFLNDDICMYSSHYVMQQAKALIEDALNEVNFKNEKIIKLRKEFLKETLEELKKNIKGTKLKTGLKKDATDERNDECEPSVQAVIQFLLNDELILSDENKWDEAIENDDQLLLSIAVHGFWEAMYNKIVMVLAEHERRAYKLKWGTGKEEVRFSTLDKVLKQK